MTKKRERTPAAKKRVLSRGSSSTSLSSISSRSSTPSTSSSLLWSSVSYPVHFVYNFISASIAKTTSLSSSTSSLSSSISSSLPALHKTAKNAVVRGLRRRYLLSYYTRQSARAVFSRRWMKQAVRWDLVGVSLSKCWGTINSRPLPLWARRPIYQMWGHLFKCNMDEVRDPLHTYPTLAAFFARELKEGARRICEDGIASPVDGRVISCGMVSGDLLEQIKGKTYSLSSFLGCKYENLCMRNTPEHPTKLFQCIIYLSPGDYHRIHFPSSCTIHKRRHFPGTLFPVNYPFLKMIPSLFALNERVVLMGDWEGGFFSMTAVGAYNVGSIELKFDSILKTNQITRDYTCPNLEYFSWNGVGSYAYERDYRVEPGGGAVVANKGDECGQFHFGSTVVLIFEAPDFQFCIQPGDYVQMGNKIGEVLGMTSPPTPSTPSSLSSSLSLSIPSSPASPATVPLSPSMPSLLPFPSPPPFQLSSSQTIPALSLASSSVKITSSSRSLSSLSSSTSSLSSESFTTTITTTTTTNM